MADCWGLHGVGGVALGKNDWISKNGGPPIHESNNLEGGQRVRRVPSLTLNTPHPPSSLPLNLRLDSEPTGEEDSFDFFPSLRMQPLTTITTRSRKSL